MDSLPLSHHGAPVLFLIDVQLIYIAESVSSVQKRDSVINIHVFMCMYMIGLES